MTLIRCSHCQQHVHTRREPRFYAIIIVVGLLRRGRLPKPIHMCSVDLEKMVVQYGILGLVLRAVQWDSSQMGGGVRQGCPSSQIPDF